MGKVSVKPAPWTATAALLITSRVSTEGWPPVTITGLKDLLMPIEAPVFDKVALMGLVLTAPSALVILPAGMVLLQDDPLPVTTSKEKVQLAPALSVTPCSWARLAPGLTIRLGPPAQLLAALAGLATVRPLLKVLSSMARLVSWPFEVLLTVMVTRETPPGVTAVGEKDLLPVMPVVMASGAVALPEIVPPELLKSEGWMMFW